MKAIVDTDVTDVEIDGLIDEVGALMGIMINTGSIHTQILRGICRRWVAYSVMQKDPDSRRLGEYSEDRQKQKDRLWKDVQFMLLHAEGGLRVIATREGLT